MSVVGYTLFRLNGHVLELRLQETNVNFKCFCLVPLQLDELGLVGFHSRVQVWPAWTLVQSLLLLRLVGNLLRYPFCVVSFVSIFKIDDYQVLITICH